MSPYARGLSIPAVITKIVQAVKRIVGKANPK